MSGFRVSYLELVWEEIVKLPDRERVVIDEYVKLLETWGPRLTLPFCRQLERGLYELRPDCNRLLYFYHRENRYIMVHIFRKQTQKTPRKEIRTAQQRIARFLGG